MATIKVSTDIAAPVEQVFELFTDIQTAPNQVAGIYETKMLTPGGFQLGTRWLETRKVLGRPDEAEMEVTAYERNRRYTVTHTKAGIRIDAEFGFTAKGNATTVSIEFGLSPHGLPPALLAPLEWAISSRVRDVLRNDLEDLKASVERVALGPVTVS